MLIKKTCTKLQCGGAGIYVKHGHEYEIITDLSKSIENISESIFDELKRKNGRNITIGSIYIHHSPITDFVDQFLKPMLDKIEKGKRLCALLGDFNVDLLKYESHLETSNFYDTLSSFSYRPLILHPTRVTSKSNTLIDNIFINNVSCSSVDGNITSSISDHFLQFSQTDIFDKAKTKKQIKYGRSYKNFNQREFQEELYMIVWSDVFDGKINAELSFSLFFNKIETLLDDMAPIRKLTKKEIGLNQRPWITKGLLTSMKKRDKLLKLSTSSCDPLEKINFFNHFKKYRNLIVTLLRRSKCNYYAD